MKRKCLCLLTWMLALSLSCNVHRWDNEAVPIVYIVPTTHMDMDFTRSPSRSMELYDDFIAKAIETLEKDKSLRYSIAIASAVEHFLGNHPGMEPRLAALIKNGQIEVCANWSNPHWSELPDELMVREIAGAKWWLNDRFGVWTTVADNGELADPTPQLAQVLASCEVPFFHSAKITQFDEGDYDGLTGVFHYLGLDGTSVLWDSHFYNMSKSRTGKLWDWPAKTGGVEEAFSGARTGSVSLYTAGGQNWDDSFPDFERLSKFVKDWNADNRAVARGQFRFATYAEYFNALAQQPQTGNVPAWTGQTEHGELLYRWGWDKCRDRALFVNAMKAAEALAAVCDMYGLTTYPTRQIEDLWLKIAYISTHNWGNRDRRTKEYPAIAAKALREAYEIRDHCAQLIADAAGHDITINTLCFGRDGIAGLGWKKRSREPTRPETTPRTEVENRFFRVKAHKGAGLVSIYDKQNGRELFKPLDNGSILRLRSSYEEGMGAERLTVSEKVLSREEGGLSSELLKAHDAEFVCESIVGDANCLILSGVTGTVKCEISVCLTEDRIDIHMGTSGKYVPPQVSAEIPKNFTELLNEGPMFFTSVEFDMPGAACARVSAPFGSITMPVKMPEVGDGGSFSSAAAGARSWYAAYNEKWHVQLQCIVGARAATPYWLDVYDAESNFGVTWAQYAPYANMFRDAQRPNRFHKSLWRGVSDGGCYLWSFRTHKGDWQKVNAARFAEEMNHPAVYTAANERAHGTIPPEAALLEVEPESVIVTCFKKARDGRGYILRLCETADRPASLRIRTSGPLAAAEVEETNMIENAAGRRISGQPLTVALRPFEIKTLRLIPCR